MPEDKNKPKGGAEKPDSKDGKKNKGNGGKDGINRQVMAANYGFALAFMNSDPELKKLFNQAVKNTWAADKFIARLRNTDWFKSKSAEVRNAILQEKADPASYEANIEQMYATVSDTYGQMFGDNGVDEATMRKWAKLAHRMGWSESQLVDRMTEGVDYQKLLNSDRLGGSAAEMRSQVSTLLQNYGIKMGEQWQASQLERLVEGNDTVEGLQGRVQELAMREYKAFADRIAGGETVMDIANPYMAKMADLLELNPFDVDLQNDLIQKALKQQTPDGQPAAMDLYTFEKEVRKDNRWQYTQNARKEVGDVTSELLRSFGVMS